MRPYIYADVKLDIKDLTADKLLKDFGLDEQGDAQIFHTQNILRRILKYMPADSSTLQKLTVLQTDVREPQIVTDAPQAQYLYYGMLMVDPITGKGAFYDPEYGFWSRPNVQKVLTDTPLNFNTNINTKAGPFWDRALVANELDAIASDLQNYLDTRSKYE